MLTFTRATLLDIGQLQSLAREIWTTCYPGIISMEQIDYMLNLMYSKERIEKEITSGVIWEFVNFDNAPIGFIALSISNNTLKLDKMYLKNIHHGKGMGREALGYVKKLAKENEYTCVYLTVNKNNTKAIKAYERAGFIRTDDVVNEIGGGYVMDDYIYTFYITPE